MKATQLNTEQLTEIEDAYDEATGQWVGCDWTTDHGPTNLDLDGEQPSRLREVVDRLEAGTATEEETESVPQPDSVEDVCQLPIDYTDDDYDEASAERWKLWINDLRTGADWLEQCEGMAMAAEDAAKQAMYAIREGRLHDAAEAAREASSCESTYGDDPTWCAFRRLVEEYCE